MAEGPRAGYHPRHGTEGCGAYLPRIIIGGARSADELAVPIAQERAGS